MTTDTTLIEKREELKRRLAAGEYKTPVDVFLGWFERLLRKILRRTNPLPLWIIAITLYFVLQSIAYVGILITGGWKEYRKLNEAFGLGSEIGLLINISIGILFIISVIIINQYIGRLIALWRDTILDATETEISLKVFNEWLERVCDWRLYLLIIIPWILLSPYAIHSTSTSIGISIGYGLIFLTMIINLIGYVILYQLFMVILLSSKLRQYDIKLFTADPSSSEIMSRLSDELGFFVYYIAIFAAIITLGTSAVELLSSQGVFLVLILWLPIIVLFIFNQTSLSSIIRRAKWKTLNEIQAKVLKLQATENFESKEIMDAINRLLDYHERVSKTRISALDFRAYLNFINSLLLPLLAFLLGNLDNVLSLFARKP